MSKRLLDRKNLILIGILVLGIFLRFYRFSPNLIFNGEMGTDYMNVWQMLHGTRSWLIGPTTSHEWLSIAPLAYWIYSLVMLLGKFNPISINIFWGIVGVLAIPISYYYIKKLFNKNIALTSSFLVAVSPALITQARDARYNLVVTYLFLPYLYYLVSSIKDKGKSLLKLGLVLGIMMSFFPSPLLLIPALILTFIFFRVRPKLIYILKFILGFLIPNITFLIYEIGNRFEITYKLLAWVPYRVLGFFGVYQKNTVNVEVVNQNILSAYKYFGKVFGVNADLVSILILIVALVGVVYFFKKNLSNRKKNIPFFTLVINLLVFYLGLFIHGSPPEHYYYTIYLVPLILVGYFINNIVKTKMLQIVITTVLTITCISSLVSSKYFFTDFLTVNYETNAVPYDIQIKAVNSIFNDANGLPFSIKRIGIYDKFKNNFTNNYIYLLTLKEANINPDSDVKYTIIEGQKNTKDITGKVIFSEREVYVVKN